MPSEPVMRHETSLILDLCRKMLEEDARACHAEAEVEQLRAERDEACAEVERERDNWKNACIDVQNYAADTEVRARGSEAEVKRLKAEYERLRIERDALLAEVERLREQLRQVELERDMLLRYGVPRAGVPDFLDEADDDRR